MDRSEADPQDLIVLKYILNHGMSLSQMENPSNLIRTLIVKNKFESLLFLIDHGLSAEKCFKAVCELQTVESIGKNTHWSTEVVQRFSNNAAYFHSRLEYASMTKQYQDVCPSLAKAMRL